MPYRDDREGLRERVQELEAQLAKEKLDPAELALLKPQRPGKRTLGIVAGAVALLAVGGVVAAMWARRAAERELAASWNQLSACLVGEPLADGELASTRARRIQLAMAGEGYVATGDKPWPWRCQEPALDFEKRMREEASGPEDKPFVSHVGNLASRLQGGIEDQGFLLLLDPVFDGVRARHLAAAPTTIAAPAPAAARPLDLATLGAATITKEELPSTDLYFEPDVGVDRHVLVASEESLLCSARAGADALRCRPLPASIVKARHSRHDLRLLGSTDAGAAPLVFVGKEGEGGIFRSDTGELVIAVRAQNAYSGANGYVAVQAEPSTDDGSGDVYEQAKPGAEVTRKTVKFEAQDKPASMIHRSALIFDKAIIQLLDRKNLDRSPWVAVATLGKDDLAGKFARVGDLNWINTTLTGCRGARGTVVRFGPDEALMLFHDPEGDKWQGPVAGHYLDELRCDGADAVYLGSWPPRATRCTPAGCQDEGHDEQGKWTTSPQGRASAVDLVDGKIVAAWATEKHAVRVRVAAPARIGQASDIVVFDDLVGADGKASKVSVLSGLKLMTAGSNAFLLLATSGGIGAIRIKSDGTFAPAKIDP
jgi:hypothetical protein